MKKKRKTNKNSFENFSVKNLAFDDQVISTEDGEMHRKKKPRDPLINLLN